MPDIVSRLSDPANEIEEDKFKEIMKYIIGLIDKDKHSESLVSYFFFKSNLFVRDHPFKMSACVREGGVSPCADGQKFTVHKDRKSPS